MPFAVVPKETVTKHFIFESRWEDPVVQDLIDCTLEIRSNSGTWQPATSWRLHLSSEVWSGLVDNGVSVSFPPNEAGSGEENCVPTDLHKYTGTKDKIPKSDFGQHEAYLDYPEDDSGGGGKDT